MPFNGSVNDRFCRWVLIRSFFWGFEGGLSVAVGLCLKCQYVRMVKNARGSVFFLCEKSKTDAQFPKYPAMPIIACPGYQKRVDV